jgi:hypothetical protein
MGLVTLQTIMAWCGTGEAILPVRDKLEEFGVREQIIALLEADDEATACLAGEICEALATGAEDAWD